MFRQGERIDKQTIFSSELQLYQAKIIAKSGAMQIKSVSVIYRRLFW